MGILAWIVLGGFAGWFASIVAGVGKRMGCLLNIAAGILGAVIGGAIFRSLGSKGITGFDWWSLLVAFCGALVLILGLRLIAFIFKD